MDFANRGNRPLQQQQQPAPAFGGSSEQQQPAPQKSKKGVDFGKAGSVLLLIGGALLAAALVFGLVFGNKGGVSGKKEADLIDTSKYQAVFLNSQDGQVYFGKLAIYNSELYQLSDIYYVRVENPVQPEGSEQQQQANISLAKLGNELHGPQDNMFISRDKVLFWENLKDDGQVVKAITEYKQNGGNTNQNTQQQTQQPTDSNAADSTQPAGSDASNQNDTQTP